MPSRNSKGQFVSDNLSISLPGFTGIYKILIIAVLIFPWYVILSNRNFSTSLFGYIIGKNFTGCPQCEECKPCMIPQLPPDFNQEKFKEIIESMKSIQCPVCPICPKCPECVNPK